MEDEVKQIMFDKLKEMSKESFIDEACYNGCCSVMNEIAQTLLQCDENDSIEEEKSLKDYSIEELSKELLSRDGVSATSFEHNYACETKSFKTLAIEFKYDWEI